MYLCHREGFSNDTHIVVFVTTYNTNEYSLIFALFTRINHREESVCFGCGFIFDETIESFVWLFKKWQNAMWNQLPNVIFTYQDLAIGATIELIFLTTHHKFCVWHIMVKATTKLGLTVNSPQIVDLYRDVWNLMGVEKFESSWSIIIIENGWNKNKWLKGLFEIRN